MDYVVAGFGIGAILALIGFALWELFGNVEEPGTSWLSRAAIGLMLGSLVIWAVTGVSLISHIDDSTGSHLVLLTTLVTLVAISAGAFWYWRLDREYAAAHPRPAKVPVQREAAAPTAPLAVAGDVELTEWDSWPDRDSTKDAVGSVALLEQAEAASFEPEVAVEPAVQSSNDEEAEAPNSPENESVDEPSNEVEDAEQLEPVEVAASNIRPFRAPAPIELESAKFAEESKDLDTDVIESDQVVAIVPVPDEPTLAAVVVKEESVESVDDTPSDLVRETVDPIDDDPESAESAIASETFESALLSDIDGSLATDDGGYRSPLLSDLGSDQLEGVGLAKWRPDARLTANEGDTPKSNGR